MITPLQAALLAERAYTDAPTFGKADSAGRAVVYGESIGFPGTDNVACFLTDLDALTVDVPGLGSLHAGFWQAYSSMKDELMALPTPDDTLGHSLGAALAILHAANLTLGGRAPKDVWAFEPPRVSNDGVLAKLFQDNGVTLHFYRNGLDLVTQVPAGDNWQHACELIKIGTPSIPFDNIEDHMISRVIKGLS